MIKGINSDNGKTRSRRPPASAQMAGGRRAQARPDMGTGTATKVSQPQGGRRRTPHTAGESSAHSDYVEASPKRGKRGASVLAKQPAKVEATYKRDKSGRRWSRGGSSRAIGEPSIPERRQGSVTLQEEVAGTIAPKPVPLKKKYAISDVCMAGVLDNITFTGESARTKEELGYVASILDFATGDYDDDDLIPFVSLRSAITDDASASVLPQSPAVAESIFKPELVAAGTIPSVSITEEPVKSIVLAKESVKQEEEAKQEVFNTAPSRFKDDNEIELEIL